MNNTNKAYEKLKEYALFSSSYEAFEALFWENLKKDQTDLAIELLLRVVYKCITSPGERYNEILNIADAQSFKTLNNWLEKTYKEKVKKAQNV